MYLFLDTTSQITVGLLDGNFQWMDYKYIESKKSSALIHTMIFDMLEKFSLKALDLSCLFYAAGPGSYTGMRVSEGIKDIFDLQNIRVNSFYHFQIPEITGVNDGMWISKAFKGEYFVHTWDTSKRESILVEQDHFDWGLNSNIKVYSGHESISPNKSELTKDLIFKMPKEIFSFIFDRNLTNELFYYRILDDEFQRKNE